MQASYCTCSATFLTHSHSRVKNDTFFTFCDSLCSVTFLTLAWVYGETSELCRYKREELEMIDNQGRCVITDHGAFCLFNVYGPAVTNELSERFAFKMRFYQVDFSGHPLFRYNFSRHGAVAFNPFTVAALA